MTTMTNHASSHTPTRPALMLDDLGPVHMVEETAKPGTDFSTPPRREPNVHLAAARLAETLADLVCDMVLEGRHEDALAFARNRAKLVADMRTETATPAA